MEQMEHKFQGMTIKTSSLIRTSKESQFLILEGSYTKNQLKNRIMLRQAWGHREEKGL